MYKLLVLTVVVAAAQAGIVPAGLGLAGLPINAGLGYAGLPINAGLGYAAGVPINAGLGYAAGVPALATGIPAATIAAPAVVPAVAPVVAKKYALPAVRTIEEAPIVETIPEKVEQHGYSIRY